MGKSFKNKQNIQNEYGEGYPRGQAPEVAHAQENSVDDMEKQKQSPSKLIKEQQDHVENATGDDEKSAHKMQLSK
jgi:hypothetical protein